MRGLIRRTDTALGSAFPVLERGGLGDSLAILLISFGSVAEEQSG